MIELEGRLWLIETPYHLTRVRDTGERESLHWASYLRRVHEFQPGRIGRLEADIRALEPVEEEQLTFAAFKQRFPDAFKVKQRQPGRRPPERGVNSNGNGSRCPAGPVRDLFEDRRDLD